VKLPATTNWATTDKGERNKLLTRPSIASDRSISSVVAQIMSSVKENGDIALREFTEKFDSVKLDSFKVTKAEFQDANMLVSEDARKAINKARAQIEKFHTAIAPQSVSVETTQGATCMRQPRPIENVGLYIPGGTAPLPSTVMMLAIPAKIAGCRNRVMCTPPREDGTIDPNILVAAELAGISEIYKVGGAQAIAALAYGTDSIPKVDKIFGPGNAYVTSAKMQAATDSDGATCDMPAGPSEVLVICDKNADPEFVAADLLSQAEHDTNSQVVLVSTDLGIIDDISREIKTQLSDLPRRDIASAALENSRFILVNSTEAAIDVSNQYAPEHLILQVDDADALVPSIINAGSVFIGAYSPESVGDYASGTNHVLPTYGYARSFSGVSVDSFVKQITFQRLTAEGLSNIGPTVETLARLEGLTAHEFAVTRRLKKIARSDA
jgi:histidinol dehydrogenase